MDSFWVGFEKEGKPRGEQILDAAISAGLGGVIGASLGPLLAYPIIDKKVEDFHSHLESKKKEMVSAKKVFKEIQADLPENSKHYTLSELKKMKIKKDALLEKAIHDGIVEELAKGNAFAAHGRKNERLSYMPKYLREPSVLTADKTLPSLILHEAGHLKDFDDTDNAGLIYKAYDRMFRTTLKKEKDAWKKAPGQYDDEIKEKALDTYRARHYAALGGGALGALLAGATSLKGAL